MDKKIEPERDQEFLVSFLVDARQSSAMVQQLSFNVTSASCVVGHNSCTLEKIEFLTWLRLPRHDFRGGTMTGSRGSGIKLVIPPLAAVEPIMITCRQVNIA